MLAEKSIENFKIAEYAVERKFYDVAISRFYYSLYQRLLMLIIEDPQKMITRNHRQDLENGIEIFIRKYSLDRKEIYILRKIRLLLIERHRADYENRRLQNVYEFNNNFMNSFKRVYELFNKKGVING
ncbi:MAG: hypothetical protein R6U84_10670 [Candidatus Cloacimonadales bacterium]